VDKLRNVEWPRLFAEGAAIVVSILLAFWIQAWWDERQERDDVRSMLLAVLEDFEESKENIESFRNFASAREASTLRLLEIAYDPSIEPDQAIIDGLLSDLNGFWTVVPIVTGSLDTLALSGNLGLVNSEELRRELGSLRSGIEQYQFVITTDYEFWWQVWLPFMRQRGYLPQVWRANRTSPESVWYGRPEFPITPTESMAHSQLLADKEFQNILFEAWRLQSWFIGSLDSADELLDTIISLLQQELEE